MQIEDPNLMLALKVWWAISWRSVCLSVLGGIAAGIVTGIIAAILKHGFGVDAGHVGTIFSGALGFGIGIYFSAWAVHRLMTKGFGKYRLLVTFR
jgi:hypothetical protein